MQFSGKIQLLEQLLDRIAEVTDDENMSEISEKILSFKEEELCELIEGTTGLTVNSKGQEELCWEAYLAGALGGDD